MFTQLLDHSGRVAAQHDGPPQGGARPTSSLIPGEIVADDHLLAEAAVLPPGRYRLIAGLYDPATGQRLAGPDGATFVHLADLEVLDPAHPVG